MHWICQRLTATPLMHKRRFFPPHFLLILILLLGTALRFYHLDAQSFWNDEGNSARLAERPIRLILEGAAGDIHPPGYYLLLHAWRSVTGESEFALRSFSAWCGVLTIAVAAAVGRRVGGWGTASGAALFIAIHPLSVYYSQEARMYTLLGLASALTLWQAVNLVESQSRPEPAPNVQHPVTHHASRITFHILSLALCIALGLYTQYTYLFVLAGLNLAFGVTWLAQRPGSWRLLFSWIMAHAIGGLLFAPWAPVALRASGWRPPDLDSAEAIRAITRALLAGATLPADKANYIIPTAAVLLLMALFARARVGFIKWAALGMALLPPVLIVVLGIYRPAYLKFLVASIAPLAVFIALPLGLKKKRFLPHIFYTVISAISLLILMGAQAGSLTHLYADPAYARDDYRGIATRIAAEGRPGDAILLSAPNQWEVFTYYYHGPLPVYPAPYQPTQAEAKDWVEGIIARHDRLFVLFWGDTESDPERLIEPYLAQRAYKAGDIWISTIRLATYGTGSLPDVPMTPGAFQMGESIMLTGHTLPDRTYRGGDIVPLTLCWETITTPKQRYKVFIHLLNASGALVAQTDAEPGGGHNPTTLWQPDRHITDRYGVLLPRDITAGNYTLVVGMYDFAGERLPIVESGQLIGDALMLAPLTVAAPQ